MRWAYRELAEREAHGAFRDLRDTVFGQLKPGGSTAPLPYKSILTPEHTPVGTLKELLYMGRGALGAPSTTASTATTTLSRLLLSAPV